MKSLHGVSIIFAYCLADSANLWITNEILTPSQNNFNHSTGDLLHYKNGIQSFLVRFENLRQKSRLWDY